MALVSSTAADMLAVADQTNLFLTWWQLPPWLHSIGSVKLDHPPVGLVASPGRALGLRAGKRHRELYSAVSLDALQQHLAVGTGNRFKIGDDSRQIVMTTSGTHLYIPVRR